MGRNLSNDFEFAEDDLYESDVRGTAESDADYDDFTDEDDEIALPADDEEEIALPSDDEDEDSDTEEVLPSDEEAEDSDTEEVLPSDEEENEEDSSEEFELAPDDEEEIALPVDEEEDTEGAETESGIMSDMPSEVESENKTNEAQIAESLAFSCPVKITFAKIPVEQLIVSHFKKKSRETSVIGLTSIIEKWGIVQPINVLKLEDEKQYIILDGLRRVFGAIKAGMKEVECRVWDFEDKTVGKKMANVLSLMITRSERYTPQEQWNMMQILEDVNDLDPGMIEYLTQMGSGEAMKLKDIMTCTDFYAEDIQQKLLSGALTIDAAYKKLANERKKEDKLSKEDGTALDNLADNLGVKGSAKSKSGDEDDADLDTRSNEDRGLEDGEEGNNSDRPAETFSNEEVAEMLELAKTGMDSDDEEEVVDENGEVVSGGNKESLESLNKTDEIRGSDMHQKVGQRHPVSKSVRQGTFMRDGFKCRCCGMGGNESYLAVLAFHHAVPVYLGGPDTKENGLTLCVNCHVLLHNYLMGELQVQLDELDELEQKRFRNIFKYGNLALEAQKRKGMSMDKAKEKYRADAGAKHPMPNANLAENRKALAEAQADGFSFDNIAEGTEEDNVSDESVTTEVTEATIDTETEEIANSSEESVDSEESSEEAAISDDDWE